MLWIPDALAEAIARHSNAYARVQKRSSRNDKSLADPDIRAGEILTFLGIYYYMGVVRLPARRDYWVVDPKWPKHPVTGKTTRARFDCIWRNLHLVAPDDEDVAETTSAETVGEEVDGVDDRIDIEICRVQHDMESEGSEDKDSDDSFSHAGIASIANELEFVIVTGSGASPAGGTSATRYVKYLDVTCSNREAEGGVVTSATRRTKFFLSFLRRVPGS